MSILKALALSIVLLCIAISLAGCGCDADAGNKCVTDYTTANATEDDKCPVRADCTDEEYCATLAKYYNCLNNELCMDDANLKKGFDDAQAALEGDQCQYYLDWVTHG